MYHQDVVLPAGRAGKVIELLRREAGSFILPDQWPLNTSDLNPVDYKIWAAMQQYIYQTKIRDVDELRHRLIYNHLYSQQKSHSMIQIIKNKPQTQIQLLMLKDTNT